MNEEINYLDHMKVVYKLTNKYKNLDCYEDLKQEVEIKLWELCKDWNNQLNNFGYYLFINLKNYIWKYFQKEKKYMYTSTLTNYQSENIIFEDNLTINDELFLEQYGLKKLKNYKDFVITNDNKIINLKTMKIMKENNGFINIRENNKIIKLNIKKLQQENEKK